MTIPGLAFDTMAPCATTASSFRHAATCSRGCTVPYVGGSLHPHAPAAPPVGYRAGLLIASLWDDSSGRVSTGLSRTPIWSGASRQAPPGALPNPLGQGRHADDQGADGEDQQRKASELTLTPSEARRQPPTPRCQVPYDSGPGDLGVEPRGAGPSGSRRTSWLLHDGSLRIRNTIQQTLPTTSTSPG
jgi:hypothetical protein